MRPCRVPGSEPRTRKRLNRLGLIAATCILLAGCSEEKISACIVTAEPILAARQLNMTGQAKEWLARCRANPAYPRGNCEVLYLDADRLLTDCMRAKGYVISIIRTEACQSYYQAECWTPVWVDRLLRLLPPISN
jgi:hypothetical protein